jgi:hypothetical protein
VKQITAALCAISFRNPGRSVKMILFVAIPVENQMIAKDMR